MKTTPETYGPDRATYKHWLDRDSRPIIGAASVLRTFRRKYGAPDRIRRSERATSYTWLSGFELQTVTIWR